MKGERELVTQLGEDVQAGRAIYLVKGLRGDRRRQRLQEIFDAGDGTLGATFEEFLGRLRRHPDWSGFANLIGRDEQAERITRWINEQAPNKTDALKRERLCREVFENGDGELGDDYAEFRKRLARCRLWPAWAKADPTPIERLTEGLPSRSIRAVLDTGAASVEELVERYTVDQLTERPHFGRATLKHVQANLERLGFRLRRS